LSNTLTRTSHSEFNENIMGPGEGVASDDAPPSKRTVNNSREIADCTLLSSTASGTKSMLGFLALVALVLGRHNGAIISTRESSDILLENTIVIFVTSRN
jgi:hypothetical protein